MLCAVFLALLGSPLAVPIDFDADPKNNEDLGRLRKDQDALGEGLKNSAPVQAEIEQLKAAYAKTVIESSAALAESTFDDEDINQVNSKTDAASDLFQGDIILTKEQLALMKNQHKSNRTRRQAFTDEWFSWGSVNPVIPYSYSANYPRATRGPFIARAMKFWESNTCVRFNETDSGYRVEIREANGCSAAIGKSNNPSGMQGLNLGPGCMKHSTICHELSHTFGFFHTQTRSDRDKYVDIDFTNISPGLEGNFAIVYEETHGIPYEFGSNRHYNHKDFAKDYSKPIIYAKPAYRVYQEGMYGHLPTFYDVLAVNRHFNCFARCTVPVECANYGVQDVNDCTKCRCPVGWAGDKCDERPYHGKMPAITTLTKKQIKMPVRANITEYRNQYYVIQAPPGMRVQMTPYILKSVWSNSCHISGIEVKFQKDPRPSGLQVCDSRVQQPTLTSDTNEMLVLAYSMGDEFNVELRFKAIN